MRAILLSLWLCGIAHGQGAFGPVQTVNSGSLARGLIGWWTMDSKDVSGTNLLDRSTAGHNLYLYRTPSTNFITGRVGKAEYMIGLGGSNYVSEVPDPSYSGTEVPGGFTNTGLCYDATDDALWFSDFTNNKLVKTDTAGALITSFTLPTTPGVNQGVQGVVHDATDDTLWYTISATNQVFHCDKSGSLLGSFVTTLSGGANGLALDPAGSGTLYVGPITGKIVKKYDKAGSDLGSITLAMPTVAQLDQLCWDASDGTLWATGDYNATYNLNATTGANIANWWSVPLIEGIAIVGSNLLINNDRTFHAQIPNGNRFYVYPKTGPTHPVGIASPKTISVWINPRDTSNGCILNRRIGYTSPALGWRIFVTAGVIVFRWEWSAGNRAERVFAGPTITTGTWQHICITYTWGGTASTSIQLFVNGTEGTYGGDVNGTGTITDDTTIPLTIGVSDTLTTVGENFLGSIDDVRLYDRILTTNEIQQLARNPGASSGVQ